MTMVPEDNTQNQHNIFKEVEQFLGIAIKTFREKDDF